ncbi:serine/threonine-protein kinase [Cellulomonas denverensis]|uniref:serine/threonine-protein kinase n=1 Tax=Cellulomonas denverensis TaxID=264297 RepID=UPI0035E86516
MRPLGSGGFADVFCYEQDMPRRVVAVKVLAAAITDAAVRRAFNAEADVLARLSTHPAVVTIHAASIAADGRPYLVMEYCPDTLGARARRSPLPLGQVLDTGVRVAGALEMAHRSGVLHRDIKPSNILVTTLDAPVLADFGIASALGGDRHQIVAMSVPTSAPEVLTGAVTGTVATEVWSLGATLYTLLAGRAPFADPDRERNSREQTVRRIVHGRPRPAPLSVPGLPEGVEDILMRAMSRDPRRRQPSMLAVAEELRWVQYRAGISPTAVDVPSAQWAQGAAPVDVDDDAVRGPAATTVRTGGRRAARAARERAELPVDRDGLTVATPGRLHRWRPVLIGAGAGLAVLAAGVVALLGTGVL